MNRKQRIELILSNHFQEFEIETIDNSLEHSGHHKFTGYQESHFQLIIKKNNKKINRLEMHKKINNLLKKEFETGMHALEIKIIE